MSHDPNGDDHLIFGSDAGADDRQARHAHGDAEDDAPPAGPPVYETQPASYPQPPAYTEPPAYAEHPTYAEPPAYADPPSYLEPPAYADPPSYLEPPAYADPPSYPEPPSYIAPPPAYAEPSSYPQPPTFEAQQGYGQAQDQPQDHQDHAPAQDNRYVEHDTWSSPEQGGPDTEQTVRRADLPTFEQRVSTVAQFDPVPQPAPMQPPVQQQPVPQQPFQAPPQGYAPRPEQQQPLPRPEDLLVQTRTDLAAAPASWGWRGKVNRGSGGLIKAKAAPDELAAREAIVRIQRSFSRPMTVVVVQPKGGAGKTPTTICLSAAFGAHRGGYVVGWDDNETRGTLAVRVANPDNQQATVWDLLSDLSAFERFDARVGDLSYYVRAQPDAHFDALVSDDNPGNMAQIGEDEYQRLHRVLQRFYRMVVVDTGNNVRSPNWQAAVNSADLVVVVSTYQRDVGWSASWVLDHLAQTGREELARNAVTVLTAADPTSDKQVRSELQAHFARRTRAVVEIPYDPELAHGGPINWVNLAPATRNAWVEAGATVADALAEQEQRVLQARRA